MKHNIPKYQVTEFAPPNETIRVIIDATEMRVPYQSALQLEVERWYRKNQKECWLEENSEGLVALFSHKEYQRMIEPEEAE